MRSSSAGPRHPGRARHPAVAIPVLATAGARLASVAHHDLPLLPHTGMPPDVLQECLLLPVRRGAAAASMQHCTRAVVPAPPKQCVGPSARHATQTAATRARSASFDSMSSTSLSRTDSRSTWATALFATRPRLELRCVLTVAVIDYIADTTSCSSCCMTAARIANRLRGESGLGVRFFFWA